MPGQGPTTLQIVTLILGIIGSGTGLIALCWNITQFMLGGHRIKVYATYGCEIDGDQLRATPPKIVATPNITVRIANIGRAPVTVRDLDICPVGSGKSSVSWTQWKGPSLPHRLEQGSEAHWLLRDVPTLEGMLRAGNHNLACRMGAVLATGRTVLSDVIVADPSKVMKDVTIRLESTDGHMRLEAKGPDLAGSEAQLDS